MYIHTKLANIHILEKSQLILNQNRKTFYIGLLHKIPTLKLVTWSLGLKLEFLTLSQASNE